MVVGVIEVLLHLHGIASLKQKRSIVKSVVERLKSRFNASVSEIAHNDSKLSAVIGISVVSNDSRFVNEQLDKIITFMRNDGRFMVGQIEREIF